MTGPLPRSLTPLPDESLPGYVLRLAHRLDLAPARLEHLTGLAQPPYGARARNILTLDPDHAAAFAHATRLTAAEVGSLTLDSLQASYPPVDPLRTGNRRRQRLAHGILVKENWIFARFTRYCPQCLAGDGSDIQTQHGGGWSKFWRLPIVFACTTHHRLLEHVCPSCAQPALSRSSGEMMLPRRADLTLHPTACRTSLRPASGRPAPGRPPERGCDQRLDRQPAASHNPDLAAALVLQNRLLTLLRNGNTTGGAVTAGQHITDLRILACIIGVSWPLARPLISSPRHAELIDQHIEQIRRQISQDRELRGRARDNALYDQPPIDAATNAALLATAAAIVAAGDTDTARHLVAPLLGNAPSIHPWIKQFLRGDGSCSPGLHTILGPEVGAQHIIKRTGMPSRATRRQPPPETPPTRFGVQHIPQRPPQQWLDRYLGDFNDLKPRLLEHALVVRLAHRASGNAGINAAAELGIPRYAAANATNLVNRALARSARNAGFDHAVEELVCHLDADAELVDYRQRRTALNTWQLNNDQWNDIIDGLPEQFVGNRRVPHTHWGDGKRRLASTWVWTQVTHGDHIYAPAVRPDLEAPRPGGKDVQYVHTRWRYLEQPSPWGHYRQLHQRLNVVIHQLASDIDSTSPARIANSGTPSQLTTCASQ